MSHTDSGSAFKLTLVDGNDTAAYYFCHICDVFPEPMTKAGDEYTVDGLHPNDAGNRKIAEKLKTFLEAL